MYKKLDNPIWIPLVLLIGLLTTSVGVHNYLIAQNELQVAKYIEGRSEALEQVISHKLEKLLVVSDVSHSFFEINPFTPR